MASIPYTLLLSQKNNVIPLSTIQDHQKFCRKFIKAHQTFEKYKNNSQNKIAFYNDTVYLLNQKQSQLDIIEWLNSLKEEEKLSLLSIKNKWLVNIFTQLFFIYYKIGNYKYKPLDHMHIFFDDQKNYFSKEAMNSYFQKLESNNKSNIIQDNSNNNKNNDKKDYDIAYDELNMYSSFFESIEIIDKNYKNSEKGQYETQIIENIRVISSEKDNFDTITFTKNFITNTDNFTKILKYFSNDNYFKDWIIPIKGKNTFNFVFPYWMHSIQELSLSQLILGFFEQKILVNYEYYYYTKQYYEGSFDNKISDLYNENIKLEKFISNNYSFNKNNKNKEEILTPEKITKIIDDLRGNVEFNKKVSVTKEIFNKICSQKACYIGKEISFNDELGKEIDDYLNKEILKEKKNNYISKLVDLITFVSFLDIINFKENIFYNYRKSILDSQNDSILDELLQYEELPQRKNTKKHKKKKRKSENENIINKTDENKNKNTNKINPTPIKINIYDVQTKEIECEYNMNSRNTNMIPETASNILIDSCNNNNNLFIRGNKKSEEKKPPKIEKPKIEEKKEKDTEKEKKDEKKEEKKEKDNEKEKKEDKKEEKKEDLKEDTKEKDEEKSKDKNKNKDFFLYPINKEKKNENNINCINVKNKKKKNKKHKNSIKEDEKEKIIKNKNIFNYVQERKNNVQINPCPRRKKNVLFQTSPINFEMHNQFPLDSYPYYYSFPMMKPFTSLSEVSTKFSMPSTKISNNKQPQNTTTNNNINLNINNNSNNKKSHWDSTQYNNNYKNALQIFNSFIPSEKYFESLNKELNNYLLVTNLNITNLKELYDNKLEMIENLLRNSLSDNYEIKFGHYGSFFSDLSIEGSDLDILVYYQKKTEECDFYRDLLTILKQNENEFENICPILTATVPVIKLQIDIRKEIKDKNIKLKNTSYLGEDDLTKIKIDLTCSENEQEFQNSHIVMSYINKSLTEYPQIKSILLFLKRYFKQMNMNKNYTGGLCSYSLFLLVLSFCKCNKQCESSTKLLYYFMENFTYFDYCNYYIDAEKDNCYILKEKNDNNTEKSVSDENSSYDTNYELYEKEEIYIVDPITKNNVAKSSFKVDEIILTFRKAFNLLYYEGWYYDYCSKNNPNENTIIENANELYEDNSSDYMIIKKLFGLKSSRNNFDFYFN